MAHDYHHEDNEPRPVNMECHVRNAIHIFAEQYRTLEDMIAEFVQNTCDAETRRCKIVVNLQTRVVQIMDNGNGSNVERMRSVLATPAESKKKDDRPRGRRPLGEFGIGLYAAVNKCDELKGEYFLITGPREGKGKRGWEGRHKWDFTPLIRPERSGHRALATEQRVYDAPVDYTTDTDRLWWTTWAEVRGIKQSFIDTFRERELERLLQQFGHLLDEVRIELYIKEKNGERRGPIVIERQRYTGEIITVPPRQNPDCGQVEFDLRFKANPSQRNNLHVGCGTSEQTIAWPKLVKQVENAMGDLDAESTEALGVLASGHFEGVVKIGLCKLSPNRKEFVMDDAFLAGVVELIDWAKGEGRARLRSIKSQSVKDRRQGTFEDVVREIFAGPLRANPNFFDNALNLFGGATVTNGHTPPVEGTGGGTLSGRLREKGKSPSKPKTIFSTSGTEPKEKVEPKPAPEPKDIHLAVIGEGGSLRKFAPGERGLQIALEVRDSEHPFTIDLEQRVIYVNTADVLFGLVESLPTTASKRVNQPLGLYAYEVLKLAIAMPRIVDTEWPMLYTHARAYLEHWVAFNYPAAVAQLL